MIKKYIPMVLLAMLVACEKESNEKEFQFDYKITRYSYINEIFGDSIIYYYNDDGQLLKVDKYNYPHDLSEYYVSYYPDKIDNWNGTYNFGPDSKLISREKAGILTEYSYSGDKIIYLKESAIDFTNQEVFYSYEDENVAVDSTVIYHTDQEPAITVYHYLYTDTLVNSFMRDYSGLPEMPLQAINLRREAYSPENDILYRYSYEISENQLIQYTDLYSLTSEESSERQKTVYLLERNTKR